MSRRRTTAVGAGALGLAALLVTVPAVAWGADEPEAFAEGRFLAGTVGEQDFAAIVELDPATAVNDGSTEREEESNPFSATALDSVEVAPGTTTVADDTDGADAGVIGQYAAANADGSAYASSGLAGPNGAVGVSPAEGATATLDLATLLGDALPDALTGLRLEAAGIAAEAEAALGEVRGDSTLADLRLVLDVPAIAGADDRAAAAIAPLEQAVGGLESPTGPLADAVDGVLASVGLGGIADIDIDIDADLDGLLDGISGTVLQDPALSIDLGTGTIRVDLAALPSGGDLNAVEPGTELLSQVVVDDVADGVGRLVTEYSDDFEARLVNAVEQADVVVSAHVSLLEDVQTGEAVSTVTTPITQIVDTVTGQVLGTIDPSGGITSLVPGTSPEVLAELLAGVDLGPIDDLLGGGAPDVTTVVTAQVSTVTEPLLTTLETSADVVVTGTLADFEAGTAVVADADAQVLGAPVDLDAAVLIGGLADAVSTGLTGPGGPLDGLTGGAPGTGVLDPILSGIGGGSDGSDGTGGSGGSGTGGTAGGDGLSALADLVSLRAGVQSFNEDGSFTQTALRVALAGGDLATIDLANATVGSAAAGGPGTPGDPGDDGPGFAAEGTGVLADTGFWATLIALLGAAFIGLGAWAMWRTRVASLALDAEAPVERP